MTTINKAFALFAMACGCALFTLPAAAQSMYRCGSTYQDRPCEGKQAGKLIGGSSSSTPTSATASDVECTKRGSDSLKIVWKREAGAMQDQQLANASSASEQKLINDVYARRGTSSDIRAAIEADCIAAKEKAARMAALLEANGVQQNPAAPRQGNPAESNQVSSNTSSNLGNNEREAASKKKQCDRLKSELDSTIKNLRSGGNAATMEDLNQKKRDLEQQLKPFGC